MTITATAAATRAGVTVGTIRTWCRKGVVAAIKNAGRWVIDTASLAHRISLGKLAKKSPKPIIYSIETMTAIGGSEWTSRDGSKHRVYINDWHALAGLDVSYYKTGNVNGATLGGRAIANGRVAGIANAIAKVYYDTTDGALHVTHYGNAEAVPVRYLDGHRDTVNLVDLIHDGVRAAIAAL